MAFTFEKLRVYRQAEENLDLAYELAALLPPEERFNLAEQLRRAAVGVVLNIGESTERRGPRDAARFLRIALGSLVEVVACIRLAHRRHDVSPDLLASTRRQYESLYRQLHVYRRVVESKAATVRGRHAPE